MQKLERKFSELKWTYTREICTALSMDKITSLDRVGYAYYYAEAWKLEVEYTWIDSYAWKNVCWNSLGRFETNYLHSDSAGAITEGNDN